MLSVSQRGRRLQLVWSEHDVTRMELVIGSSAERCAAPYNAGILWLANHYRVRLSPTAQTLLETETMQRQTAKRIKALDDVEAQTAGEQRAFPHQRVALELFRTMLLPGYLLADQPGVGKTLAALLHTQNVQAGRTLIVTPNKAKRQWRRAIRRWIDPQAHVTMIDGTIAEQTAQARTLDGWVIAHWESLVHAWEGLLADPWDMVILDEAHHINNREAQRTGTALALVATNKLALDGHPFSGNEAELFPILEFLYPETYTSKWRFLEMHVKMTPKPFGGFVFDGARHPKLLSWEMAPFTIRRTKQRVFKNLPPITRIPIEVELTARGRREYEKLKRELFAELDAIDGGTKTLPIINEFVRLTRVRQYLVDPGLIGAREKSAKYPAIRELIGELDAPLIVFSEFRKAVEALGRFLSKRSRVGYFTGGLSDREADRIQRDFLAGKFHALLVVAKAGDTALNFGKYGNVSHLDLPWTPRALEQREGRVDRPEEGTGKLVPTTAWMTTVADSYEDRQKEKLERRHAAFGKVFSTGSIRRLFGVNR